MKVAVCMDTSLTAQDSTVEGIKAAALDAGEEIGYVAEVDSIAALHFAFSLCEKEDDTVTAVSYGGAEQDAALEYALAYGVTSLHRLEGGRDPGALIDPMVTARALATWLCDPSFDVIVCGNPSGTGAVPAVLAGLLGVPSVSRVYAVEKKGDQLDMQQRLERGWRQQVSVSTPCLVTVQAGFFSPMYVSVKRRQTARKHASEHIEIVTLAEEEATGAVLQSVAAPRPRAKRKAMPASGQSASNRLKSITGGGGSRKSGKSKKKDEDEEKVRELEPEKAAQEIIDFLRKKELLSGSSDE